MNVSLPHKPSINVNTGHSNFDQCSNKFLDFVKKKFRMILCIISLKCLVLSFQHNNLFNYKCLCACNATQKFRELKAWNSFFEGKKMERRWLSLYPDGMIVTSVWNVWLDKGNLVLIFTIFHNLISLSLSLYINFKKRKKSEAIFYQVKIQSFSIFWKQIRIFHILHVLPALMNTQEIWASLFFLNSFFITFLICSIEFNVFSNSVVILFLFAFNIPRKIINAVKLWQTFSWYGIIQVWMRFNSLCSPTFNVCISMQIFNV